MYLLILALCLFQLALSLDNTPLCKKIPLPNSLEKFGTGEFILTFDEEPGDIDGVLGGLVDKLVISGSLSTYVIQDDMGDEFLSTHLSQKILKIS